MPLTDALAQVERLIAFFPIWLVDLSGLMLFGVLAIVAHRIIFQRLTIMVANRDLFWRSLVSRTQGPSRLFAIMVALALAQAVLPLSTGLARALAHFLTIALIILLAWMAQIAVHIWTVVYLRRFKLDAEDNLLARKHVTQSNILRRVVNLLIIIIAVAACLMTFERVWQYGLSLLASAGAAGVVIGLALQPVLKNLFAGIQLAITQPIRIDDALLVEGEWGNVEEITSTYVVIRIWDWRRMVLPLSYFIEKPFQNWTREGAALIGTVMIYLDYMVPIDELRRKVEEIARRSSLWDGKVVNVQITDFKQATMEVRILVSASTSPRTFDLRCQIREELITFLRAEYPHALPQMRLQMASDQRSAVQQQNDATHDQRHTNIFAP
ncbi:MULTISPECIES: mechanosensitive ion channel family protein [unclassified Beijerinckia]|uniref:mechanosensitive ion channel family protein n=1 Tax=unclassified Beijerinckia TaxID=2638183 RepID=UPI00089A936A|nr:MULTISPECIES: mechanosensitive ion channel family protein [unclassified Beijerinckia]MDH7797770.1 small-conductance mechanosensitive channel [Beijerinckia sp. GAS462]SEC98029.1 Small-conductance mechanosensitive channel [Beijerinckia sp. 28-YEA-48]